MDDYYNDRRNTSKHLFVLHITSHIIIIQLHVAFHIFHFMKFPCFMSFTNIKKIFHLILCHACIFQRSGYGKELYVPEDTITVRDSDL